MNTLEIDRYATNNRLISKSYIGCFAADELPTKRILEKELPCSMVVNLCNSAINSELCHWVGIYISKGRGKISMFDSSGLPTHTLNKYIKTFIARQKRMRSRRWTKKTLETNNRQIQSYESVLCGKFVLCFLWFKANKMSTKKYVEIFKSGNDSDLQKNDEILTLMFDNLFNKNH